MRVTDEDARRRADAAAFREMLYRQAVLPDSRGGISLGCADAVCEASFLTGVASCLEYIRACPRAFHVSVALDATCQLPLFADLRRALAAYRAAAPSSSLDLSTLLSASPPLARRVLAEGVWEQRQAEFLAALPDVAEDGGEARAWYLSVSSPGAVEWLRAIPVSDRLRAPSHIYRLALLVRFGADIPEFVPTDEGALPCGALRCSEVHDRRGRHPSVCTCANRAALTTDRHNALQAAVLLLIRGMGQSCRPVGRQRLCAFLEAERYF